MAEKSEVVVLGCHLDDPATRSGMKKVLTRLQALVPMKDKAGGIGQKTLLIGDYGIASLCKEICCESAETHSHSYTARKVLWNLSDASSPASRCEGLISGPAEWHKKKVKSG